MPLISQKYQFHSSSVITIDIITRPLTDASPTLWPKRRPKRPWWDSKNKEKDSCSHFHDAMQHPWLWFVPSLQFAAEQQKKKMYEKHCETAVPMYNCHYLKCFFFRFTLQLFFQFILFFVSLPFWRWFGADIWISDGNGIRCTRIWNNNGDYNNNTI